MDWLTFVERTISHIAWPVVLIVGLLLFRGKLREILGRTIEVLLPGGTGVKLSPSFEQRIARVIRPEKEGLDPSEPLPFYLRTDPEIEPFVQEAERRIKSDLNTIPAGQQEAALIRNLVLARIGHWVEVVYNTVFGGQLRLLTRALQAGNAGMADDEVRDNYEEFLKLTNWSEKDFTEAAFVNFLITQQLLEKSTDGRYRITGLGRVFLRYLVLLGRNLDKFP
jgi:hypothetical protein